MFQVKRGTYMKLVNKYSNSKYSDMGEYFCDVTYELDRLANIKQSSFRKHYVLNGYVNDEYCLPIRIPGGTLGGIWFDDNNVITKIIVDTNYIVTYPSDVNEQIQKFVGQKIEF